MHAVKRIKSVNSLILFAFNNRKSLFINVTIPKSLAQMVAC